MAYNLHIFRGDSWLDGADDPITAEELLSVAGVKVAENFSTTNPRTGIVLSVPNLDMYSFGDAVFILEDGMITLAARNDDAADIIRPLADALGAVIQGDEGEFY